MNIKFYDEIESNPVIAAVKNMDSLNKVMQIDSIRIVFILFGDICNISDIVNDLDGVLEEFDNIIGLDRLKAIHLNDSLNPCGSHKDRHARIGEGQIGLDAITRIINHEKLKDLPFLLETPNELDGYAREIKLLRSLYKG